MLPIQKVASTAPSESGSDKELSSDSPPYLLSDLEVLTGTRETHQNALLYTVKHRNDCKNVDSY